MDHIIDIFAEGGADRAPTIRRQIIGISIQIGEHRHFSVDRLLNLAVAVLDVDDHESQDHAIENPDDTESESSDVVVLAERLMRDDLPDEPKNSQREENRRNDD
jgi:hypothetical protein